MKDGLSILVSFIVACFLMFSIPISASMERKDQLSYLLAFQSVVRFVDDICNKGVLSAQMYIAFADELRMSGLTYDWDMKHITTRIILSKQKSGVLDLDNFTNVTEEYYNQQIYEHLFPSEENKQGIIDGSVSHSIYYLKSGDSFELVLKSKERIKNSMINPWFLKSAPEIPAVYIPYGCLVKNEIH